MSAVKAKPDKQQFTPENAIHFIEQQMGACWRGETDRMICPYCRETNIKGQKLCCDLFKKAVIAILKVDGTKEQMEALGRIAESVDKQRTSVIQ